MLLTIAIEASNRPSLLMTILESPPANQRESYITGEVTKLDIAG
jgi:hypothetical protein